MPISTIGKPLKARINARNWRPRERDGSVAGRGIMVVMPILRSWWTYVAVGLAAFYLLLYLFLDLASILLDTRSADSMRTLLGALATDLITAQALVFTISLVAAQVCQHLPQCVGVVAGEIDTLERSTGPEFADSSYLSAPRSQALGEFRIKYLARS